MLKLRVVSLFLLISTSSITLVRADEKSTIDAAALKRASSQTAAQALAPDTVAYAEIARPKELIAAIYDHPLRTRVEELPEFREAMKNPKATQARFIVALIEQAAGMKARPLLETIAAEGVYVGASPSYQGAVVLMKSADAAALEKAAKGLLDLARGDAKNKNKPDPVAETKYRGIAVYRLDKLHVALLGPWLIAATDTDLGRGAVDRLVDGGEKSLASEANYQSARKSIVGKPATWAYLNVDTIRAAGLMKKVLVERTQNIAVEAIAGGVLSTLEKTPFATASVYLEKDSVRLALAAPHEASWASGHRQFYFGPEGKGAAPELLRPKHTLLSLSVYRDLGALWQSGPDLLDENGNAELTKSQSDLSTLFSGRDFGRDILGSLRPEISFVAARQDFSASDPAKPSIKLPAFALAFRCKNGAETQDELKLSFQNLIGFFNIVGAQNGQPPLNVTTEKVGPATIVSTAFMQRTVQKEPEHLRNNFSPSVAIVDDRFIIASSRKLATELASAATETSSASERGVTNLATKVDLAVVAEALKDNRETLVAQSMLKKGHDKAAAEKEVERLLTAVRYLRDGSVRLENRDGILRLEAGVRLAID
jgi:hypothetical protein